jgi:hypothetical protein
MRLDYGLCSCYSKAMDYELPYEPGVYCLFSRKTRDLYIGQAEFIKSRVRNHFATLKRGKHCNPLVQASYDKCSGDGFIARVVELKPERALRCDCWQCVNWGLIREAYYFCKLQPNLNILNARIPPIPWDHLRSRKKYTFGVLICPRNNPAVELGYSPQESGLLPWACPRWILKSYVKQQRRNSGRLRNS